MVVADAEISLTLTGNGDVIEPEDGIIGNKTLHQNYFQKGGFQTVERNFQESALAEIQQGLVLVG